jgi:hypothetical protein
VFLGANTKDDVSLKFTIVAQNADIVIKQSARTTIQAIR